MLHDLAQTALRVGKRVHAETGIDRAGASSCRSRWTRPRRARRARRAAGGDRRAPARWARWPAPRCAAAGVTDLVVANRSPERAERLAGSLGGRAVALDDLAAEIAAADLLVCSTGATGLVVEAGR